MVETTIGSGRGGGGDVDRRRGDDRRFRARPRGEAVGRIGELRAGTRGEVGIDEDELGSQLFHHNDDRPGVGCA